MSRLRLPTLDEIVVVLPRITLVAVLVLSAQYEYAAGQAAGLGWWAAAAVPVMVDSYALVAVLTARDVRPAMVVLGVSLFAGALHRALAVPGARLDDGAWVTGQVVSAGVLVGLIVTVLWRSEASARDHLAARAAAARVQAEADRAAAERARTDAEAARAAAAEAVKVAAWRAEREAVAQREHELAVAKVTADAQVAAAAAAARTVARPAARTPRTPRPDTRTGSVPDTRPDGYPDLSTVGKSEQVAWFRVHVSEHPDWSVRAWADATGLSKTTAADRLAAARRPHAVGE